MVPHACVLAFLISAAPSTALTVLPPASNRSPPDRLRQVAQLCCGRRSSSLTRVHARGGSKGRRRGSIESGGGTVAHDTTAAAAAADTATAAAASIAVQHATHDELLEVAYANRSILKPAVLSQALLRIAKPLVQIAKRPERKALLKDPRLKAVFMAASSPAAGRDASTGATNSQALSGPQAADIVWACGLLRWLPTDVSEGGDAATRGGGGGGGSHRLAQLVEFVARTALSKRGIDDGHITNVLWALERLGVTTSNAEMRVQQSEESGASKTMATPGGEVAAAGRSEGERRGSWDDNIAVKELRRRVESLPFRAIPSLFEGLRVEDFKQEVAFGRDEILLGGGKVLSESRLTAWQSSDNLTFAYSGKTMEPAPFSPNVLRLRDALYERTGVLYDGVLLNLYGSRSSAMRYHSDPDVGTVWTQDTSVVSVGDTRQFALRKTLDHNRGRHAFHLFSGDCVRMTEGCQRDYQHCVKVAKDEVGERISLVFKQSISGLKRDRRREGEANGCEKTL